MAEFPMSQVRPVNAQEDNTPNHMIIWLDKHIGKPEECILLKKSFFMAMDPTTGLFERNLNPDDIDRSILFNVFFIVRLEHVEFIFQAFNDIEKCYRTIEENLHKRIFFITSGSMGKIIVPSLVKLHPETFPENNPIFIFCANLIMKPVGDAVPTNAWLQEFLENVLPFDHQDDLLARMTREMSNYFAAEAQRFTETNQLEKAHQYQGWSQQIRQRHNALIKKNKA
jgi:hypothetical protein